MNERGYCCLPPLERGAFDALALHYVVTLFEPMLLATWLALWTLGGAEGALRDAIARTVWSLEVVIIEVEGVPTEFITTYNLPAWISAVTWWGDPTHTACTDGCAPLNYD